MAEQVFDTDGKLGYFTLLGDALTPAEREKILALGGEDEAEEIEELLDEAEKVAKPKAMFMVSPIEEKGEGYVVIEGVRVNSALMRKNFDSVGRVFPYVATCGLELEKWAEGYHSDMLAEFWCEEIRKMYLGHVIGAFRAFLKEKFALGGYLASMNPGSIIEWPLTGQLQLFTMLGRELVLEKIDVRLTDSMLMLPSKSVSGIIFESEKTYENCSRCPILRCPNRRAKPDADIVTR